MRITGGDLKGRQLHTGFANHVRPSTDRVRESLFNSLQNQINLSDSIVLDLFSGSGIIALEFISRNTPLVLSVDLDKKNIAFQKQIRQDWQISGSTPKGAKSTTNFKRSHQLSGFNPQPPDENSIALHTAEKVNTIPPASSIPQTLGNWDILLSNVWTLIPKLTEKFDIIFADPPYHMPNLQQLPSLLLPLLNPNNPDAVLLFEHKPQLQFPQSLPPSHTKDYGSSVISYFIPNN